jgi:hypothetical protein
MNELSFTKDDVMSLFKKNKIIDAFKLITRNMDICQLITFYEYIYGLINPVHKNTFPDDTSLDNAFKELNVYKAACIEYTNKHHSHYFYNINDFNKEFRDLINTPSPERYKNNNGTSYEAIHIACVVRGMCITVFNIATSNITTEYSLVSPIFKCLCFSNNKRKFGELFIDKGIEILKGEQ